MGISKMKLILVLTIAIPIVLMEGAWVFRDARKRGEKYYWFWGIFASLNTSNLFIYLLITRVILKHNKAKL